MLNNLSIFITITQGLITFFKWLLSIFRGDKKTFKQIYKELEFLNLKRQFRNLKKDHYGYKYLTGAKLLSILKNYFSKEKAKKFILVCKSDRIIDFDNNFDVNEKITIRNEEKFVEKIIDSC